MTVPAVTVEGEPTYEYRVLAIAADSLLGVADGYDTEEDARKDVAMWEARTPETTCRIERRLVGPWEPCE